MSLHCSTPIVGSCWCTPQECSQAASASIMRCQPPHCTDMQPLHVGAAVKRTDTCKPLVQHPHAGGCCTRRAGMCLCCTLHTLCGRARPCQASPPFAATDCASALRLCSKLFARHHNHCCCTFARAAMYKGQLSWRLICCTCRTAACGLMLQQLSAARSTLAASNGGRAGAGPRTSCTAVPACDAPHACDRCAAAGVPGSLHEGCLQAQLWRKELTNCGQCSCAAAAWAWARLYGKRPRCCRIAMARLSTFTA